MLGVSFFRTSGSSTTSMLWSPAASANARRSGSAKVRLGSTVAKIESRNAVIASASLRNVSSCSSENGSSSFGSTQFAERW